MVAEPKDPDSHVSLVRAQEAGPRPPAVEPLQPRVGRAAIALSVSLQQSLLVTNSGDNFWFGTTGMWDFLDITFNSGQLFGVAISACDFWILSFAVQLE